MMSDNEILHGKKCPYCNKKPQYVDSIIIYGRSYGMIYLCGDCDAYVGVHKGTNKSLGRLANRELREAKKNAHKYFDELWQKKAELGAISNPNLRGKYDWINWKNKCRSDAYRWLSDQMGKPSKYTHIGMFNVVECNRVINLCKPYQ
jgi:hypothetical protein